MTTKEITIRICDECLFLQGEMCDNPKCVFCWRDMIEVAEYLNVLLIAPIIDGRRVFAHPVYIEHPMLNKDA